LKSVVHPRRIPITALSVVITGDDPPGEFRIFTAGEVDTTKGKFLFDEAAAESVMAEYTAHGIDLMIDYDHASLAGVSLDPAQAGKAAGWFNLELRNGELWAVNVRWTEPAAEALRRKEWRFMSPAFSTDEGRITSVLNVAITNIPATRRLEPLMAASVTSLGDHSMLSAETIKEALDALIAGDEKKCMDLLKGIVTEAASGEPASEEPPAEEPAAALAEAPAPPEEDKPEEVAAALSAVASLSGKASIVASVADIRTWHASHVALSAERQKLAEREAVLEGAERRKLCVELVSLGGRAPSTVWADDKCSAPKPYLAAMPIADLRAMHADALKANKTPAAPAPPAPAAAAAPPASTAGSKFFDVDGKQIELSARELKICEESKCEPQTFAMLKARRASTAAA